MDDEQKRRRRIDFVFFTLIGWIVGILLASVFDFPYLFFLPIIISVGIFIYPKKINGIKIAVIAGLIFMSLAILRFNLAEIKLDRKIATLEYDRNLKFSAMVVTTSTTGANGSSFVVKGEFGEKTQEIKLLVRESEGREFQYGDIVSISGKIEKPKPFETNSGSIFDYPGYLKKDGIVGIVKVNQISITEKGKGNIVVGTLLKFEHSLEEVTKVLMSGMKGSLTTGVLLGDRAITKENQTEFVATGTSHIIALSGYNVSIVSSFFRDLFSFLPLAGALAMGGLAILLFVIMTGFQSTAVRAGVMAGIVLFAKSKGREAPIGKVIIMAVFIITLINPLILYYDVSFQLSFLATIGIIYFSPKVAHWFLWLPEKKFGIPWREIAVGTIGTQIFVLPFILYKTGVLSTISPITNILILPFIPYLMAFGAIVAILGVIFLPLALPFAFVASGFASAILYIIHITAQIPLASTTFRISALTTALLYGFLIWYFEPFRKK